MVAARRNLLGEEDLFRLGPYGLYEKETCNVGHRAPGH